jgi:hypothetical protein
VTSLNIFLIHAGINITHGTYESVSEDFLKYKNASKRDFNLPFNVPIRIIMI